ncbi:sensor histidine kinase [Cutibacterium sp. WCA-380-WT-3A]|uniref:histidine kinase n=1 Tax=Cutibacterium porci TaxID=2605781 RepID=A0A7K0J6W3_9ACTN|nr:histidine kinase [Cutibacterium porci]MSS45705.1 sensor histidine kinase [Cutibacterium porci]
MNSASTVRNLIFEKDSRTATITAVIITVLVLSGLDDLRVAVATHRSDGAMIWTAVTYVFSVVALLCWKHPIVQELLLLIGLVSSVMAGNLAFSIPLLVVLAFFASQRGLGYHLIPAAIGTAVIVIRAAGHNARWVSIFLVTCIACIIGIGFGSAFRWLDNRREQAEKQAADALEQAAHAREEERQQLAAELHDMVAKDLTVITMLAGSLRLNTADEAVITASKSIETTSRTALDDLQRLLLVLRNRDLPLISSPTHEDSVEATVAAMVTRLETLGWHVESSVTCAPMPVSVSDAINRILDESTANAIKHNGPSTAKITVMDDGDDVVVTVSNPVIGSQIEPVRSTGMGIARLKERVTLLRGEISIGLRNGWWVVNARIPRAKPLRET